ncbi:Hsp70 family protein [Stigmatella sp. ncwal1]|uniref:Hsp70 family protein n=1 Tax=Stigmatella ashevillensis TaxID=2995309 RepID=A0ABT5D994_9BACT|nr:Hsp70 family protein [Stigmatella ashevillena]MDC0709383.1 Hsp70 family protein [Stigmatella ashevillena]
MARYAIGIDLGTTHCAVSYFNLEEGKPRGAAQSMLPIPQLTAPGTVEPRPLLPSFLYLPSEQEFPAGSLALPWNTDTTALVGEFARSHGAKVPTRLVSSAKSWLSHPGVDRRSPLLPWQAPPEVRRVSPLDASARYLRHLREAWDATFARTREEAGSAFAAQDVIITVPASFDAAARELTLEAAQAAGIPSLTLLEEPQAALYAWLEAQGESFRKKVKPGEVILVVDVGGGTSDFSVITVREQQGEVELVRVAVGDHILLGGDNMDLTLAHTLSQKLAAEGKKLDPWQFNALTYGCRQAKEALYADPSLGRAPISIPGRGSSLIGGTLRTELPREELDRLITDGFFPPAPVTELPRTARRTGLAQMALPYAQDAGVTRHLASFLTRQAQALANSPEAPVNVGGKSFLHPTSVLFNGGVFKAGPLKSRVMEVLNGWLTADGGPPAQELQGADLDLSVARGAAYYGWVRQGHGLRIRGGTARAYYVGVETAMPAVPGMEPPVKALCVAPFGMEEGTQADVPAQEFGLVTGEPTRFRFFASSVRRDDKVGAMLDDVSGREDLDELAPIETTLPGQPQPYGDLTPVNLQAVVTEVGTLELRCVQKDGSERWKLELNVRMRE